MRIDYTVENHGSFSIVYLAGSICKDTGLNIHGIHSVLFIINYAAPEWQPE